MITGGVASVIYGDPRFTRDVDVVLELDATDVEGLAAAFSPDEFYVPPLDALREEAARPEGGHFTLIHRDSALRSDIYVAGEDPLHAWALGRRSRMEVGEIRISVAPIEYVILRKLQYFRESGSDRHLRDVSMMLRISGEAVDLPALREWIDELALREVLEKARRYPSTDL